MRPRARAARARRRGRRTPRSRRRSQVHPLDVLVGDHVGGGTVRDRATVVEDSDDVGQRGDQSQVVLDDEDRAARAASSRSTSASRSRSPSVIPTAGSSSASTGAPVATARAICRSRSSPVVSSAAVCALGQPDQRQQRPGALVVVGGVEREQDLAVRRQRRKARGALERARHGRGRPAARAARAVVLPLPLRPIRAWISPARSCTFRPSEHVSPAERAMQVAGRERPGRVRQRPRPRATSSTRSAPEARGAARPRPATERP